MHKFKESLTAMIGDFANMNKTPDFKHEELEESHTALKEVDEHDDEDETLTEAEEERIRARIAEQRERRPSSYLL
ncbi:unnamed protein product, partial [Mesorhabditis spiculigera]